MIREPVIFVMAAEVDDLFSARLISTIGTESKEYVGYVPDFFPGGGDYFEFRIDINTGDILNWKTPSKSALTKTFGRLGTVFKPNAINITGKCRDMLSAHVEYKGHRIGNDYMGYVPDFFPGQHWGDYVEFEIELDTGTITNWNKPTKKDLKTLFGESVTKS